MHACWREYDECGWSLNGVCTDDDTCVCEPNEDCLPCAEQVCESWEVCGSHGRAGEFSTCHAPCSNAFIYDWDPEVGCTISLPENFPAQLFRWFYLEIDRIRFPRVDSCEQSNGYWIDERALTITVCGEACSSFESVGWLETGWAIPCE
jgi:hypothetical protein